MKSKLLLISVLFVSLLITTSCETEAEKNIKIQKVIGVNEDKISLIKKNNLEMKNFFSKLGIFLIG